jgi:hypothetical protein
LEQPAIALELLRSAFARTAGSAFILGQNAALRRTRVFDAIEALGDEGSEQPRDFRLASGYVDFDAEARRFGDARWNGEESGEAMATRLNGETAR